MKPRHTTRISVGTTRLWRYAAVAVTLAASLLVASPALARPLVVIDPGHGGIYNNARYGSLTEKHANLLFALELGRQLYAAGYDVNFTRTTDTAVTYADIPTWHWVTDRWLYTVDGMASYSDGVPRDDLQARCDIANNLGADVFISIHCNGSESSAANGTENWASSHDALGIQLGRYVQSGVLEQTRQRDRGAGQMDFYVVRWANMPALLIETGFMSNPTEGWAISNASWRQTYVRGIVNGLNRWMATDPIRPVHTRLAGSTRSETAVQASQARWGSDVSTVILGLTSDTASALSAPLAASRLGAPLLFADITGVAPATAAEIARLHPTRIIALGAEIPDAVLAQAAVAAGIDPAAVERVSGTEPLSVAPLLSQQFVSTDTAITVVLASGDDMSDSLAGATLAASTGAALVLAHTDGSVPAEASDFLAAQAGNISSAVVIGAVPASALAGVPNRTRIGPAQSYHTFISTVAQSRPAGSLWLYCYNPLDAVDSLTAASAAASRPGGAPVPIAGTFLSPYVREWLENSGHRVFAITMIGNTERLPAAADHFVAKAIY